MILIDVPLKKKVDETPLYSRSLIKETKKKLPLPIVNNLETFKKNMTFVPIEIIGMVSSIYINKEGKILTNITLKDEHIFTSPTLSIIGIKAIIDDEDRYLISGFLLEES